MNLLELSQFTNGEMDAHRSDTHPEQGLDLNPVCGAPEFRQFKIRNVISPLNKYVNEF